MRSVDVLSGLQTKQYNSKIQLLIRFFEKQKEQTCLGVWRLIVSILLRNIRCLYIDFCINKSEIIRDLVELQSKIEWGAVNLASHSWRDNDRGAYQMRRKFIYLVLKTPKWNWVKISWQIYLQKFNHVSFKRFIDILLRRFFVLRGYSPKFSLVVSSNICKNLDFFLDLIKPRIF